MPQHLADIFETASADEGSNKRPSQHITGARVLTSNEHVAMVREKDKKEKGTETEEKGAERMEKEREGERTQEEGTRKECKKAERGETKETSTYKHQLQ